VSGDAADRDRCTHCGAEVGEAHPVVVGERTVERATCPRCALQLVRRPGEAWRGIRG
jgi:hypothetical protein